MPKRNLLGLTQLQLEHEGWCCDVTERWIPHAKITKDLFGFLDLVAIRPGRILGVQATSRSNVAARVKKILAEPRAPLWIRAGAEIEVWGWRLNPDGSVRDCRVVALTLEDFGVELGSSPG